MRFVRNPAFEEELRAEPSFDLALHEEAVRVQGIAQSIAPHGPTGDYERSLSAVGPNVVTFDHAGHIVEWGSVNSPAYGVLRRAARSAGLRLEETPKA